MPLILQWEIADLLHDYPTVHVIREHRVKGEYLDTREGLLQVKEVCDANGWTTIMIAIHPAHAWRVKKMAEKIGLKVVVAKTSEIYDPKSKQRWTRGRIRFLTRDVLVRIYFLFKGWL